jgi:predicted O-linked N-acetylglucosamine transferase (SPINDLY family)
LTTGAEALDLAIQYHQRGDLRQAEQLYRQILQAEPHNADALHLLGVIAQQVGRNDAAIDFMTRALQFNPRLAEAHHNLGVVLKQQGRLAEAEASYRQALRLKPDYADAHNHLGNTLKQQGRLAEAEASYRQALRLKPDYADAYHNLGHVLKDQGELGEAVACYRRAVQLKPDFTLAHSSLVYTLSFCPDHNAAAIYEEHRLWNQIHAERFARLIQPHGNDRSPERRLRIGYLSPDFRHHPVGRFLLPLLEAHDHAGFEIYCYAWHKTPDGITQRCRARADVWREVSGHSDEQLALAIRQDRVDVLVDLTMHMGNNRLLVFARKPAPVQVTYLAYCGTTGLRTMDYRLTDPYLDPPGQDDRYYSEESIRLPETYWCYQAVAEKQPVHTLPSVRAGHVTFGSLNNFCKVTAPTLAAWSRLLQVLPQARLLLHAPPGSPRDRVREFFSRQSVLPDRLSFADRVPPAEYYQLYDHIDVALDTFPYSGGTTTCDALWMGVPVISLAGQTAVGRGGLSILSNIGLAGLVARDAEQYVAVAAALANDLPRLGELRATLRERMQASPLMDAPRFARHVEAAYRGMWQRWCAKV